jgi:hypothetical protein
MLLRLEQSVKAEKSQKKGDLGNMCKLKVMLKFLKNVR